MARRSYFRRLYLAFLRGISANSISRLGVILTTSAFLLFVMFEIAGAVGLVSNAYFGLVSYLALPAVFIIGLVLIPFGWWLYSKKKGRPFMDLFAQQFSDEDLRAKSTGARVFRFMLLLTLINLVFLGVVGTSTVHFMDQPHFCGTACHSVMGPEWATYQASPHAHVACIECHVGEGVPALINAKLNGAWQVVSASFELYERPIPTPVHNLRPARETCEECHWPDKFHGDVVRTRTSFKQDEASSPRYTALIVKTGSGAEGNPTGSHWHVADRNEVRYASVDDKREQMIWVEVKQPDGTWKRYENKELIEADSSGERHGRTMDCIDCHNRATHIYEDPSQAVDAKMAHGNIPRTLPFIKKQALSALLAEYADKPAGLAGIDAHLRDFYKREYPELLPEKAGEIDQAVTSLQAIYERNVHPEMNITWGAYPSHLGHVNDQGCFRCHNWDLETLEGETIEMDCDLCHNILAEEDREPVPFLEGAFPAASGPMWEPRPVEADTAAGI